MECNFLDAALADARDGRSRAVVLRGEAGAGKSALLDFAVERADGWRICTAVGIESEMELAYSGLHQLCAPMLDHLDGLPAPQRSASVSRTRSSAPRRTSRPRMKIVIAADGLRPAGRPGAEPVPGRAGHDDAPGRGRRAPTAAVRDR
jgi:hypothetical protein